MSSQFQTFRELLLHCLKCHDNGDSQRALMLIDEYLSAPEASRPAEQYWSEYNVQQALGFRTAFIEKIKPFDAPAAEERHLTFCNEQLHYWLSAAADSSARLAVTRFREGRITEGHKAASDAARLAGALGLISATVAQAAEEARKHTKP